MKIATWNVNSLKVRLEHVLDWLASEQPDVLALQETKLTDENFPVDEFEAAGYHVRFTGQKTYNGVALISRSRPKDIVMDIDGLDDPDRRIVSATFGDTRVLNLYVVNGQEVGSDKYAHKLHWLSKVTEHVEREIAAHPRFVVVGDFNIAQDDRDVWDAVEWRDKILCSPPEREALQRLLSLGLTDAFRQHDERDKQFSWWDYRGGGFQRGFGLRIDLILASDALRDVCSRCWIDDAPRRLDRPSDHTPVVAEFD
ncbi:MAG: exodeoxyribonuclease-3 [Gammaproteobacteria bacterium]|jgi:exodeoxyribonuclease-3